jgi:betaine-aldehyde dehydrogenase
MNFGVCAGQSCGSNSRLFLHADIRDEFLDRMSASMDALRVGTAYEEATEMGPVVSRKQYDRVLDYIAIGRDQGATLVTGGGHAAGQDDDGFFVAPTLFSGVTPDMRIAREEIFGPVVSAATWTDYDQMIREVNDVDYGLAASIWTDDLHLAHKTAERVEAGYIWVNDANRHYWGVPFGGMKNSGLGREEAMQEMLSYLELQAINVVMKDPAARLTSMTTGR